jgi:hypothetical protein
MSSRATLKSIRTYSAIPLIGTVAIFCGLYLGYQNKAASPLISVSGYISTMTISGTDLQFQLITFDGTTHDFWFPAGERQPIDPAHLEIHLREHFPVDVNYEQHGQRSVAIQISDHLN